MWITFIISDLGEHAVTGNLLERAVTITLTPEQIKQINIRPGNQSCPGEYITKIVKHS